MNYPLTLTFKLLTVRTKLSLTDASGRLVYFVRQKSFRLREAVNVFADAEQTRQVASIRADRIIDFSATYSFEDMQGRRLGAVRRSGMRSLWKADYEVLRNDAPILRIREDSAFVRFMDGVFGEIPVIGILSGLVFNPSYAVTRPDGTRVMHVKKHRAFWEGTFTIERQVELSPDDETAAILAILMMVLLERSRG